MNKDTKIAVRNALQMMRDHAKKRLLDYCARHRMRVLGWHFMIDSSVARSEDGSLVESGLVMVRALGERFYCIRVTVEADESGMTVNPEATVSTRDILELEHERVAHLIFARDSWTQTKAVKKQSDKIIENAKVAPDLLEDAPTDE